MKPLLACACLLALLSCSGESKAQEKPASETTEKVVRSFRGKVTAIMYFDEYNGKVVVVAVRPSWVVTIAPVPDKTKDEPAQRAYAIHSPTKLFAQPAEEALNKTFDFTEYATVDKTGKVFSRRLKAVSPEESVHP